MSNAVSFCVLCCTRSRLINAMTHLDEILTCNHIFIYFAVLCWATVLFTVYLIKFAICSLQFAMMTYYSMIRMICLGSSNASYSLIRRGWWSAFITSISRLNSSFWLGLDLMNLAQNLVAVSSSTHFLTMPNRPLDNKWKKWMRIKHREDF